MTIQLRETYQSVVPEPTRARLSRFRRRARMRFTRATAPMFGDRLTRLARGYGTDKGGPRHSYTEAYERHLGHRRHERLVLLEIGVGGEPFQALFPAVRPGGTYVIEDLETSYLPRYGGRPRGSGSEGIATGFIADLLDGLHAPGDPDDLSYTDRWVGAVHVYPEMAVIEKRSTPRERRGG